MYNTLGLIVSIVVIIALAAVAIKAMLTKPLEAKKNETRIR